MFDSFTKKITGILDKLKKSGTLSETDIENSMREIRIALLSADVSLSVVKKFIESVKEKALGQDVLKSLSPGQTIVKIVRDNLVELLGGTSTQTSTQNNKIDFSKTPTKIMLVGLQGAGKTTSAAKIANLFKKQYPNKSVLLSSIDVYRPAAIDQLKILAEKISADFFETDLKQSAVKNAKTFSDLSRAKTTDLLILDTAGRLQIDEVKMDELEEVKSIFCPDEILLVADIMTGQEAINIADTFNKKLGLTGIILTRVDGDAKGGVALSMKDVTGVPIKYVGTGEGVDKIEPFYPERMADRILDMGDVISLIEKAQMSLGAEATDEAAAQKIMSGSFDLEDFSDNLKRLNKLGGIMGVAKFLPQFSKISDAMAEKGISDNFADKYIAIINSMTALERRNPNLLNASRKKRIAAGSGTNVQEVNKLLKQFENMKSMFRIVKNMSGKKGFMDKIKQGFKR